MDAKGYAAKFLMDYGLEHLTAGEPIDIPQVPLPPMGTSWCRCKSGHIRMTCLKVGCNSSCFKDLRCTTCMLIDDACEAEEEIPYSELENDNG